MNVCVLFAGTLQLPLQLLRGQRIRVILHCFQCIEDLLVFWKVSLHAIQIINLVISEVFCLSVRVVVHPTFSQVSIFLGEGFLSGLSKVSDNVTVFFYVLLVCFPEQRVR